MGWFGGDKEPKEPEPVILCADCKEEIGDDYGDNTCSKCGKTHICNECIKQDRHVEDICKKCYTVRKDFDVIAKVKHTVYYFAENLTKKEADIKLDEVTELIGKSKTVDVVTHSNYDDEKVRLLVANIECLKVTDGEDDY